MLILTFHIVLVSGVTLRILLRDNLSPTARLAWFAVIMSVPVIGSFIYFLFGEVHLGKAAEDRHKAVFDSLKDHERKTLGEPVGSHDLVSPAYRSAFEYAASISGFQTVPGNRAQLMPDATAARQRLIADIDRAKDHVHVLYYIWLDDDTGSNTARALIRAAQRGVTCRAMADGLGSKRLLKSKLWQDMRNAGVKLGVALPIDKPVRTIIKSRLDLRNHRKITVIDGHISYCGSQNCADPEFRVKAKYAPWVDILVRLEGPVVAQNQLLFASDWLRSTSEGSECFPLLTRQLKGGFAAQVVGDGPTERLNATPQLFATLLHAAIHELTISTPYFVPDATVLEALCSAAHRGVRVTLIFPANNDSWVVAAASRSNYLKLLNAGVVIHEFEAGLLHAKTLTIDSQITFVGSSNMDMRSFNLNFENDILLQDKDITEAVRVRQQDYVAHSRQVRLADVARWPAWRRIWNNIIATIGPVL